MIKDERGETFLFFLCKAKKARGQFVCLQQKRKKALQNTMFWSVATVSLLLLPKKSRERKRAQLTNLNWRENPRMQNGRLVILFSLSLSLSLSLSSSVVLFSFPFRFGQQCERTNNYFIREKT